MRAPRAVAACSGIAFAPCSACFGGAPGPAGCRRRAEPADKTKSRARAAPAPAATGPGRRRRGRPQPPAPGGRPPGLAPPGRAALPFQPRHRRSTGQPPRRGDGAYLRRPLGAWRGPCAISTDIHRGGASRRGSSPQFQGPMADAMTLPPQTEKAARAAPSAFARGGARPRRLPAMLAPLGLLRSGLPPLPASLSSRPRSALARGPAALRSSRPHDQAYADRFHPRGRNPRGGAGR